LNDTPVFLSPELLLSIMSVVSLFLDLDFKFSSFNPDDTVAVGFEFGIEEHSGGFFFYFFDWQ
jgi:hypothetical protein